MKAAQIREYGSADVIAIADIDIPSITDDQVLVEVRACSVNPFDTMVREGALKESFALPFTLGGDISGTISKIGKNVHNFTVGEKVYGQANVIAGNSGAFAEYAATKASQVGRMPDNISFEAAAALPLTGVSALQVLTEHIKLQPDQKILIHGGAGGIGTIAIQIAKHLGAYVATTATGDGLMYVKDLGADEVVDYTKERFDDALHDYDAVFDTVGGDSYDRSFKVLKKGGIIVSMTIPPNETLMKQYNVRAIAQQTRVTTKVLEQLTELIEKKVVTPHVDNVYPLGQVKEAFEARESGKVKGKVVLRVRS